MVGTVLGLRFVRRVEETGRLVCFEGVGNLVAGEDTAGESCTTLPKVEERHSHSFQERSCSWGDLNEVVGHYWKDSGLLPGLDSHGLGHGHGRQHRVHPSHAEL